MFDTPAAVLVAGSLYFFSSAAHSFVANGPPPVTRSPPFVSYQSPTTRECSRLFYSVGSDAQKPQDRKDKDEDADENANAAKFQASNWNENARRMRIQGQQNRRDDEDGRARGDNEDSRISAVKNNQLRIDFRLFLTQRALQSFCFLCEQCRDVHTVGWLESLGNYTRLSEYHGLGALVNTTWDGYFMDLMKTPEVELILEVKRRGPQRGSKNNPFLKDDYDEYIIPIDPTGLSSRILSVREQISREMVQDLMAVKNNGDHILETYIASIKDNKERENLTFERFGTFHLDYVQDPNDEHGYLQPSPLRKANFDLLTLIATQESVHRLLREYKEAGSSEETTHDWFKSFYFERVESHFDGNGKYDRAYSFINELISTPPVAKKRNKMLSMIDPVDVAERILKIRAEVVENWLDIAKDIGVEHTPIRRALLNKQMGVI